MGGCREYHSKEVHNLYYLPETIRVTKSRGMKLTENVAHLGKLRNAYKTIVGKSEFKIIFWRYFRACKNIL